MIDKAAKAVLQRLDPRLTHLLVASKRPDALRRFAHACAMYAVQSCQLKNSELEEALALTDAHVTSWPSEEELAPLKRAVLSIAGQWDDAADTARTALEDQRYGAESEPTMEPSEHSDYVIPFRRARAATSVARCLEQNPLTAATEACYEALHATRRADDLIALGETILSL
jgi:hypothetical protein